MAMFGTHDLWNDGGAVDDQVTPVAVDCNVDDCKWEENEVVMALTLAVLTPSLLSLGVVVFFFIRWEPKKVKKATAKSECDN